MKTRRLDQLCREIGDHPDLLATREEWVALLGDDFDVGSPLLIATRELATTWPCGLPGAEGCSRQVIHHAAARIVAVCPEDRCDKVRVEREQLILRRLDLGRLARHIGASLDMDAKGIAAFDDAGTVGGQPTTLRLGARPFGAQDVAFYLTRNASSQGLLPFFEKARLRDHSDHIVVLVPRDDDVDLAAREAAGRRHIDLLALDRLLDVGGNGRVRLDLSSYVSRHRFPGVDPSAFLWPRYWLVLDPREGRYWYGGRRIEFPARSRRPQTLLLSLAARPGETVVRNDLCPAMWPDEYGGKKTLEVDWDRRIRDQKSALSGLLATAAAQAEGLPQDPIRAVSGSDVDGGYVLDVPGSQVFWWSGPTA